MKKFLLSLIFIMLLTSYLVEAKRLNVQLKIELLDNIEDPISVSLDSVGVDNLDIKAPEKKENILVLKILDENMVVIDYQEVGFDFYIPGTALISQLTSTSADFFYDKSSKYLEVYFGGEKKLNIDISKLLCNYNNICENSETKHEELSENFFSCPSDCKLYNKDGICNSNPEDYFCDLDCYNDEDCGRENCNDNIKNQDEIEIDKGGVCELGEEKITLKRVLLYIKKWEDREISLSKVLDIIRLWKES